MQPGKLRFPSCCKCAVIYPASSAGLPVSHVADISTVTVLAASTHSKGGSALTIACLVTVLLNPPPLPRLVRQRCHKPSFAVQPSASSRMRLDPLSLLLASSFQPPHSVKRLGRTYSPSH